MRSSFYTVFSFILFGILYCFTALIVFILLILAFLKMQKTIFFVAQKWAIIVFLLIGKTFVINGKENIVKGEKYILVANHSSLFDIVAIMAFYPGVAWFGHERLLKVPLFSQILRMTNYVPFKEPTVKNTKLMISELEKKSKKQTVAIFPEGTRTLNGQINEFYKGFIYLFRTTEIPILPVTLNGFYNLKPKNRFYINFNSRLEIIIHKPIKKEELLEKSDCEIIKIVREAIQSAHT